MAKKAASTKKPTLYQLSGDRIQITYSTSSFAGPPLFHYHDATQTREFKGKEIRTVDTELGTLVTVTLNLTPDLGSTSFTLLIPHVGLGLSDSAHIVTDGITTLHRTSIIGPALQGQTDFYTVHRLQGTAAFVVF
jgi:hypothetical protein